MFKLISFKASLMFVLKILIEEKGNIQFLYNDLAWDKYCFFSFVDSLSYKLVLYVYYIISYYFILLYYILCKDTTTYLNHHKIR